MKIYSPNKNYTGVSASVPFCNGVGETEDPHLIEWFKEHGYELEKTPKKGKQGKKEEADVAEPVLMEA
ncbi:hypothetical protein DXA98_10395 [Lachnospiraceae bacterium OF09-6]|nr:hypothetical protein DXA98_10395 [Lachnospiraceae bacterium OF09-6]